ncbi:hypothetical protein BDZ97DRAFT_1386400 [Flammula alnicola]|nr:hypothetical protein BDZ97DRAFT_1386400 [Flammula alnicola]
MCRANFHTVCLHFDYTRHQRLKGSGSLEIDLQGGVPPYNAILVSLELSRPSVTKIRFEQTRFIYSRQDPGSSILVAAVSDSNGEWASGTSLVNFKDQKDDVPSSQTASLLSSKASESQVPSRNDTPWHITSFGSQKILTPRSSEDYGSTIIVVDGVALAVLFIATLVVILCAIFRRRNRQCSKQVGDIPLQNVGEERGVEPSQESLHDIAQQQSPPSKSSMEDTYDQFSNDLEAALPIVPQTSPIGPLSAHSTQSHMTSVHTSLVTLLGSHHPNSYGDPYPSLERETYRSDMQSRLSRKSSSGGLSFSSFRSAKTARVIGRLARFSDSTSFNEPALSDTRSGVLSRNISNSSSSTIITKDKHSSAPVPGSSVRPSWYQVSGNAPAVPPLVFKHDDL